MKSLLLVKLSFFPLLIFGQVTIDTTKYYDTSNVGTVKKITNEKVCAIVFFVSGPDADWKPEEKYKTLQRDQESLRQLNTQLARYGEKLDIHFEVFNLEKDFKVDSVFDITKHKRLSKRHITDFNRDNAKIIWTYYMLSDVPFFDSKEYFNYSGGYFLLIYHQGMGITNASPRITCNSRHSDIPEFVTIYQKTLNNKPTHIRSTSHEILHLFGAWDLYRDGFYGHDLETYLMIRKEYPKSIMRKLRDSQIDSLTAWRIGLNDKPKDWYLNVVPKAYHKSTYQK